jgi:16S rRNA processing protein RimM
MTKRFVAGIVGGPFGVKGFVKVKPLSGEIEHLLKLKSVTLRQSEQERVLNIEESAAILPSLAIRFAGFNTPEAVKALKGAELMVERKDAAPLQTGEFYIEDLKGLAVLAAEGSETLGYITGIIEGGGGDLAEICLHNGGKKLVPFRKEFFTGIDLEKNQIILNNQWILE